MLYQLRSVLISTFVLGSCSTRRRLPALQRLLNHENDAVTICNKMELSDSVLMQFLEHIGLNEGTLKWVGKETKYEGGWKQLRTDTLASVKSMRTVVDGKIRGRVEGHNQTYVKAIYVYTDHNLPLFWLVNRELRNKSGVLPRDHKLWRYVKELLAALLMCPQYTGKLFRSRQLGKDWKYVGHDTKEGESYPNTQLMSCSQLCAAAKGADTGKSDDSKINSLLIIDPSAGDARKISGYSKFPDEEEVLLAPGVGLVVKKRTETDSKGRPLRLEDVSTAHGGVHQEMYLRVVPRQNGMPTRKWNLELLPPFAGSR